MKIILAVLVILAIQASVIAEAPAAVPLSVEEAQIEPEAMRNPVTKFGRGLCNLTTFHFELFEQSRRVKAKHGSLAGMTYGLLKGLMMSGVRLAVGAYETVTFFMPLPADYRPILTDPVSFYPRPAKKRP